MTVILFVSMGFELIDSKHRIKNMGITNCLMQKLKIIRGAEGLELVTIVNKAMKERG